MVDAVEQTRVDDLRARLRATRLVRGVAGDPWQRGTDADYLRDLLNDWATAFDWRAAEERIMALPWTRTSNGITAVHQRASDSDAPAVVLLHGWPDSFLRYQRVLPLLSDVHVIVPCLPGYPYSDSMGADQPTMAEQIAAAVAELGYRRYVISGGDIGSQVAEAWARAHPDRLAAVHLTDVPFRHVLVIDDDELTEPERDFKQRMQQWQATEAAYALQQSTRPNTLSVGLGDSPAGLAAWIVEKLRTWSDCGGDLESVFPRDDLLTWLSVYWLTGAIGTSFTPYALRPAPRTSRVEVPTAVTVFPREPLIGPRALAERVFDIRVWDERSAGGHFGAWEQPEPFVDGVRAAIEFGR